MTIQRPASLKSARTWSSRGPAAGSAGSAVRTSKPRIEYAAACGRRVA
jgi:hypothetical protein